MWKCPLCQEELECTIKDITYLCPTQETWAGRTGSHFEIVGYGVSGKILISIYLPPFGIEIFDNITDIYIENLIERTEWSPGYIKVYETAVTDIQELQIILKLKSFL